MGPDPSSDSSCHVWECVCECGNHVNKAVNQLTKKRSIPHCGCSTPSSLGELLIAEILDEHNIPYEKNWSNHVCTNPATGARFYFDFKLTGQFVFIEFDGSQHFENRRQFNDPNCYEETHIRDLAKNSWCFERGFKLLRVPYTAYQELAENHALLFQWIEGQSSPMMPSYDPL